MVRILVYMLMVGLLGAVPAYASSLSTSNTSNLSNNDWASMRGFTPVAGEPHIDTAKLHNYLTNADYLLGSTEFGFDLTSGTSDVELCQMRVDCDSQGFVNDTTLAALQHGAGGSIEFDGAAGAGGGKGALSAAPAASAQPGNEGNSGYYLANYIEERNGAGTTTFSQGLQNDFLSGDIDAGVDCGLALAQTGQARCNEIDFGFSQFVDVTLGAGNLTTSDGTAAGGSGPTTNQEVMDLFFSVDVLVDANGDQLGTAQGTFTQTDPSAAKTCNGAFTRTAAGVVTVTGSTNPDYGGSTTVVGNRWLLDPGTSTQTSYRADVSC